MTLYRVAEREDMTLKVAAYRILTNCKMWEREPKNTMVIKNVKINCGSSILREYEYGELTKIRNFKEEKERKEG
jgi:hypothetical protein